MASAEFILSASSLAFLSLSALAQTPPDGVEFFEKKIRPLLAEHCYECHSAGKKTKGGLALDSREGWMRIWCAESA